MRSRRIWWISSRSSSENKKYCRIWWISSRSSSENKKYHWIWWISSSSLSKNLSISSDFVAFMNKSGGLGFWGGNPPVDPKGSGSVGGDPPPTVGVVGPGGGSLGSGRSDELNG